MTRLPVIPDDVAATAQHGSFCPKLCNHVCPVLAATGRDDAQPWSFHRTITDLAHGRLGADDVGGRLDACTGCHACRVPCDFDQDVPAQVRAARGAMADAGAPPPALAVATSRIAEGASPFGGRPAPDAPARTGAATVVAAGCRDEVATVTAVRRLLGAATTVDVVWPAGCCGGALDDLGGTAAADDRRAAVADTIDGAERVVALDPHCLPSLRAAAGEGVEVVDAVTAVAAALAAGGPALRPGLGAVTFHDPCLLARDEGVTAAPRRLLEAAGGQVVEPEGHGPGTVCSGAGMAFELVDGDAAGATASRRAGMLAATGVPVVTACAGARRLLAGAGADVRDLFEVLADHLPPDEPGGHQPPDRPTDPSEHPAPPAEHRSGHPSDGPIPERT